MSRPCAPITKSSARSASQRTGRFRRARRPQQQDPFGIEEVLHPEAAADIGRAELDALGRHLEDELRELAADAVQPLPRQFEVHRVGRRVVARDAGARLQRHDDDAIVRDIDLDDVRGLLHRLGDGGMVAALHVIDEVARRLVPQGAARSSASAVRPSTTDGSGS